jgi:hypothetical protein
MAKRKSPPPELHCAGQDRGWSVCSENQNVGIQTTMRDAELVQHKELQQLTSKVDLIKVSEVIKDTLDAVAKLGKILDASRPPLQVVYENGSLLIAVRVRIPLRKAIAITGTIVAGVWATSSFLTQNWPVVVEFINKLTGQAHP